MSYKHFTRNERNFIEENLKLGYSRRNIAKKLGRHHSSVCDEINRNLDENGEYRGFPATIKYLKRRVNREYISKEMEFIKGYIKERCVEANNRSEIGHWEIDSVVSQKSKSRFVLISLLANGTAEEYNYGATKKFLHIPKNKRKTFTCDNGSEFAEHIELSRILEL